MASATNNHMTRALPWEECMPWILSWKQMIKMTSINSISMGKEYFYPTKPIAYLLMPSALTSSHVTNSVALTRQDLHPIPYCNVYTATTPTPTFPPTVLYCVLGPPDVGLIYQSPPFHYFRRCFRITKKHKFLLNMTFIFDSLAVETPDQYENHSKDIAIIIAK